jgi:hypothetical protein
MMKPRRKTSSSSRDLWKQQQTGCFWPGCRVTVSSGGILECHEIIGGSDRAKTILLPAFWLLLCREHHDKLPSRPDQYLLIVQLAIKRWGDPENYDLRAVVDLWRPKARESLHAEIAADVAAEYRRITKEYA